MNMMVYARMCNTGKLLHEEALLLVGPDVGASPRVLLKHGIHHETGVIPDDVGRGVECASAVRIVLKQSLLHGTGACL